MSWIVSPAAYLAQRPTERAIVPPRSQYVAMRDGCRIALGGRTVLGFGCTREACSIRDIHRELTRAGLTVAGISPQSPASHKRFREKHSLPFTLLSDERKEVIKMFGVNGPLGFWVQRVTYLVDQNRAIIGCVKAHFSIAEHEDFIRKAITARQRSCSTAQP